MPGSIARQSGVIATEAETGPREAFGSFAARYRETSGRSRCSGFVPDWEKTRSLRPRRKRATVARYQGSAQFAHPSLRSGMVRRTLISLSAVLRRYRRPGGDLASGFGLTGACPAPRRLVECTGSAATVYPAGFCAAAEQKDRSVVERVRCHSV